MLLGNFLISALTVVCHAGLLEERQHHGTSWSLYAYGGSINGLPVFYGDAVLPSRLGQNRLCLEFHCKDWQECVLRSTWIAHVNATQPEMSTRSINPTAPNFGFSSSDPKSMVLYLTESSSPTNPVGFTAPTNTSGKLVDAFYLHSFDVLLKRRTASFYARPDPDGSYTLMWSTDRNNGFVPVLLKTIGLWPQPVVPGLGNAAVTST
ncbi:hypothetical protein N7456_006708 [Penicillium angulare]|uniref:Uncharacterized protein n=1 Tax=Penicillium angulare TaxID=116970 RepID=A0A9W9FI83_9EURO|nr:hypothetical protein N7456_006708 [Penicillium angulare]